MLRIHLTWFILILSFFGGGLLVTSEVSSASYDYYVKEGENGDGSEGDPFGSIKDAMDEIGGSKGKKVFIEKGSYSASFTVPEGTVLVGADQKEVIITGALTLEDDVELEKIGFNDHGSILVKKNAHVVLEKLRFKSLEGHGVGVKTEPGSTKVTIRDSVFDTAKKGMYIQAGSTLEAENIEVINNAEEGIDIRENVNGSITKSVFRNNKESGIEIILGSANFTIRDNTFSGNNASGIAAQFFQGANKVGNVRVEGNSFSKNDYGIDCKAPQSGPDSKFYYLNSLTIINNTYKDNREGEIAMRCRIMTDEERIALEKEEADKKALAEQQTASLSLSEAALADRLAKSIELRRINLEKYAQAEHERLKPSFQAIDALQQEGNKKAAALAESRSSWQCYLGGAKKSDQQLAQAQQDLATLITRLEKEELTLRYESNQERAREKVESIRLLYGVFEKAKSTPGCTFSLFGWVMNLFSAKEVASIWEPTLPSITFLDQNVNAKALFLGTLSYYPKVREVAVRSGDERLFSGLTSMGNQYASIVTNLRFPLGTEIDPLPAGAATAEISFPLRFANYFSAYGVYSVHLNATANAAAAEKTGANLAYAGIKPFGQFTGGEKHVVTQVGPRKLAWLSYREGVNEDLNFVRETLKTVRANNESGIVVISWDEKRGKTMTAERKTLVRELVQAGAGLVIGTGLMIPFEEELIDTVPVYYSLGSAFEKFQAGDTSKKSVALEIGIDVDDKLRVTEKNLAFTAEKGLEILP